MVVGFAVVGFVGLGVGSAVMRSGVVPIIVRSVDTFDVNGSCSVGVGVGRDVGSGVGKSVGSKSVLVIVGVSVVAGSEVGGSAGSIVVGPGAEGNEVVSTDVSSDGSARDGWNVGG